MSSHTKYTVEKKAAVKNGVYRMGFAVLSVAINCLLFVFVAIWLGRKWHLYSLFMTVLSFLVVLAIYSQHTTASMKMPWIMVITMLPVAGLVFYMLVGLNTSTRKMRERYKKIDDVLLPRLPDNEKIQSSLREKHPYVANITYYLKARAKYPVYQNTDIVYFDDAKKGLDAQKRDLKEATKFIFMEYHAIDDGESWQGIQEILEQKVKEGVEVRVFYDDMGSIGFINTDFVKRLKAKGIRARVFNPFAPGLNLFLNNRDHRKITVIDGRIGYTGGYNLANEYFHISEPYGYWKDTGIRLEGDAVKSLTVTFLEMWNAIKGKDIDDVTFDKYLENYDYMASEQGYIVPYADNPMDDEQIGEEVYMSIADMAKNYVWFITPYLIITEEMIHTLSLAAKRGVDVRIITPGIPDKKIVYSVTRSYYNALARNGVRIYEYTPGFCHAKMCICDDIAATCGTINLDYRSLYHHFENGCLYADCQAVADTKRDFEEIFAVSNDVTDYYAEGRGAFLRFGQMILRLFAPLM